LAGLQLSDFETENIINFKDQNATIFSLPTAKVYHENHYSGEGEIDNTGLEWQKKRIYFNGKYIEAIPISALLSETGKLIFNATIELGVIQSSDDAQDTLFGIDLNNTNILYNSANDYPSGVIFQDVDIEQGTTISEATLNISYIPSCSASSCSIKWFGADTDNIATWSSGHLVASETKTTANITQTETTSFTPNSATAHKDLNTTALVQEIINRGNWIKENSMGFIVNKEGTYEKGKYIQIKTFDESSNSWKLTIEYEGTAPNPCQPNKNQDWIISNQLYCYSEDINIGSGNLIINNDLNAFLGLFLSSFKALTPFIFNASRYWKQQYTFDSNISVDSEAISKAHLVHNPIDADGLLIHGDASTVWISAQNSNDHWVQASLGEIHKCRDVLFPIMYRFNWFTDVNAEYYDGLTWHTIYENNNFQTTDCNQLVDDGATYYCDLNLSINDSCSKVRFQVEHDSKEAGAVSNNNSTLAMNNIVLYDKYSQIIKLTLFDSNIQIKNN